MKKVKQKVILVDGKDSLKELNEYLKRGWVIDFTIPLTTTREQGVVYFTIKKEIDDE